MVDFNSILDAARRLSGTEQLLLIDALREDVSSADADLHPDWEAELNKRIAAIESGSVKAIPWESVREQILGRFENVPTN